MGPAATIIDGAEHGGPVPADPCAPIEGDPSSRRNHSFTKGLLWNLLAPAKRGYIDANLTIEKEGAMPLALVALTVSIATTFFVTRAAAASITWTFEGVVTYVDRGILDDSVTVGTPFSGVLTFDSAVADTQPESYVRLYEQASTSAEFRVLVGG